MTKIQNGRRLFEKVYRLYRQKNGNPILKNIPTSLKDTIKGFNIDNIDNILFLLNTECTTKH